MELFYYTYNNVVNDVLGKNAITCSASSSKTRYEMIGNIVDSHMFITTKKLNADLRVLGMDPVMRPNGEHPVAIRINVLDERLKDIPVSLVEEVDDKYAMTSGTLKEYDEKKHIGCFWKSFIPFIFINGFIFDTAEERAETLNTLLTGPDMWAPDFMFELIDEAGEFTESIDKEKLKQIAVFDEQTKKTAKETAVVYEKQKAMAYYAVQATENWGYNKYVLNVDPYLMGMLGINEKEVSDAVGVEFQEISDQKIDFLLEREKPLYKLHEIIVRELLQTSYTTDFDENKYDEIMATVLSIVKEPVYNEKQITYIQSRFEMIKENIYHAKGMDFDSLISPSGAGTIEPLLAFVMFLKGPHYADTFIATLEAYKIEGTAFRLSMMYFAAANGMMFLDGTYKADFWLNRKLDEHVIDQLIDDETPHCVYTENQYRDLLGARADKVFKSFEIKYQKIVSRDEIFEYVSSAVGKKKVTLSKIKTAYKNNKKVKIDWNKYAFFDVKKYFGKLELSYAEAELVLKKLRDKKIDLYSYHEEDFFKDYIDSKEGFMKLYDADKEFWKKLYKANVRS